ncbi:MAG: ATP-binding protein, partial [Cyclobacteriaceae bacterium]|nr:ATP-binding protein [Cyclobacteriaceae bacterium]
LDNQGVKLLIAIDEFQQILNYPEKNTEALLRSIIQDLHYINFIFSRSNQHLIAMIFNHAGRPFFSSTQFLSLTPIDRSAYTDFIKYHFVLAEKSIAEDAIAFLLEWTRTHTYYTQVVCNRLFVFTHVSMEQVKEACISLLQEQEQVFYQYRQLLTGPQWKLLWAIAQEEKVYQITSGSFIGRYSLGTAPTVKRSLEALLTKEMIYRQNDGSGSYYQVYDCFLSRWLEQY